MAWFLATIDSNGKYIERQSGDLWLKGKAKLP